MAIFQSRRQLLSRLALPLVCGVAVALVGCASAPTPESDREVLLQRATSFWKTVQANDPVASWKFEELSKKPGWTLQAYMKREGISYDSAQVLDVRSVEGDRAIVNVKVMYSVPLLRMNSQEVTLQDEWVRLDGLWYHANLKNIL